MFIDHLVRAALIDGRVTRKEFKLLLKAGGQLGRGPDELKAVITRNRKELYEQARQIIRKRRH